MKGPAGGRSSGRRGPSGFKSRETTIFGWTRRPASPIRYRRPRCRRVANRPSLSRPGMTACRTGWRAGGGGIRAVSKRGKSPISAGHGDGHIRFVIHGRPTRLAPSAAPFGLARGATVSVLALARPRGESPNIPIRYPRRRLRGSRAGLPPVHSTRGPPPDANARGAEEDIGSLPEVAVPGADAGTGWGRSTAPAVRRSGLSGSSRGGGVRRTILRGGVIRSRRIGCGAPPGRPRRSGCLHPSAPDGKRAASAAGGDSRRKRVRRRGVPRRLRPRRAAANHQRALARITVIPSGRGDGPRRPLGGGPLMRAAKSGQKNRDWPFSGLAGGAPAL